MLAAHIGTRVTPMTSTFRPAASRSVTALSIDEGYGGSAVTVPVTRDDIFALLAVSRFGAYATTADGTVVFWNRRAEQILGTTAGQMLGRRESQTPGGGGATIYEHGVCALWWDSFFRSKCWAEDQAL